MYAEGGSRISKISEYLDVMYDDHKDKNVSKVFLSVGVNDVRYCKGEVSYLRSQINNLITKVQTFFPHARVFFQSVLPVFIENQFTAINILKFNRMLYEVCLVRRCYYLDAF